MEDHDLFLLLKGHNPIIALETYDEPRALGLLKKHCRELFSNGWRWSITDGLVPLGFGLEPKDPDALKDVGAMLTHIKRQSTNELFVLCDVHPFLDDAKVVRLLKDIAFKASSCGQKVVMLSHELSVPRELSRLTVRANLRLPSEQEVANLVRQEAKRWQNQNRGERVRADSDNLSKLVKNLVGLPHEEVKSLAYSAIANDGAITEDDLPELTKAKFALMDMEGILHFDYSVERLSCIAGLENLKQWLSQRQAMLNGSSQQDRPKGVMLFGVQGAGKSLAAKCVAGQWGLPLLRLDFAALYNKYIGETEKNLREALKLADLMAPCVLWIDEIEKGLAEDSDQGVGKRILGTLLTWMNDRQSSVFIVATSNDVSALPAELLRKGRFDELFFVDLPEASARREIFQIHMNKRQLDCKAVDLERLSELTDGFSGAEIEQVVVSATYSVGAGTEFGQQHLESAIAQTQPLSVLRYESMQQLRNWAKGRAVIA